MNDIDLTEATAKGGDWDYGGKGWEPIGSNGRYSGDNPFTGIFDGNGFEIKGLRMSLDSKPSGTGDAYAGLFSKNQGTIKNLNVSGDISGTYGTYTGFIAGYNDNGSIEGCTVSGSESGSHSRAGGITGCNNNGNIVNCLNKSDISNSSYCAGIAAGSDNGTISGCVNAGKIKGIYASGIVELGSAAIRDCYNTGKVSSTNWNRIAGIAMSASAIENCYNIGSITNGYAITQSTNSQNCYYLNETGWGSAGAKALTEFQMRQQYMYLSLIHI